MRSRDDQKDIYLPRCKRRCGHVLCTGVQRDKRERSRGLRYLLSSFSLSTEQLFREIDPNLAPGHRAPRETERNGDPRQAIYSTPPPLRTQLSARRINYVCWYNMMLRRANRHRRRIARASETESVAERPDHVRQYKSFILISEELGELSNRLSVSRPYSSRCQAATRMR